MPKSYTRRFRRGYVSIFTIIFCAANFQTIMRTKQMILQSWGSAAGEKSLQKSGDPGPSISRPGESREGLNNAAGTLQPTSLALDGDAPNREHAPPTEFQLESAAVVFPVQDSNRRARSAPLSGGAWHTDGSQILNSLNEPVRIAGISWYGFETAAGAPHGLDRQDYRSILGTIRRNGYNTVRLPFSNQMAESSGTPRIGFEDADGHAMNADLEGLTSLQVMDRVIEYAGTVGLHVILDNHRSEAGDGPEANGLWYTAEYPEASWIRDWKALATRYASKATVIGMDLRNEPHNAGKGGSCWGCGDVAHDWRLAAERGGDAILQANPRLLIFVEGTDTVGGDSYWWGGNLEGVATAPVRLSMPHRLVYSAHDYGPAEYAQSWFNGRTTARSLQAVWSRHWAYISERGIAPIWLSEFGTVNDAESVRSSAPGSEGQWFTSMVEFLQANPNLSWAYWAVNGDDRYGLLNANFDRTPTSSLKQQALSSIQAPNSVFGGEITSSLATK